MDDILREFNVPAPEDYYALLSLDLNSSPTPDQIKAAYRRLQRTVHPDVVGEAAQSLAVILNACYETLMNDDMRTAYNWELRQYIKSGSSFDGRPVSAWMGPEQETRAVFVAENECIGCMQCTRSAPNTFFLEEEHGRARVGRQWADDVDAIQEAVESCPVDCIYYVQRDQLALLEFVMKSCKRENVAIMGRRRSGNMGSPPQCECPFDRAWVYVKARRDAAVEAALGERLHDQVLAAAIAKAWLELPVEVRAKGWPEWVAEPASDTLVRV